MICRPSKDKALYDSDFWERCFTKIFSHVRRLPVRDSKSENVY